MIDRSPGLFSAEQSRGIDKLAARVLGIESYELMEKAGRAAFAFMLRSWSSADRIAVVCGPGNNGGDAYLVARHALAAGKAVRLFATDGPGSADAARAARSFVEAGGRVETGLDLEDVDLVVDGMLGTGVSRPLEGVYLDWVREINSSGLPVFAIDVPTGLDADSGAIRGDAIRAERTLTFICRKIGLYTGQGRARCGRLAIDPLGVAPTIIEAEHPTARLLDGRRAGGLIEPRSPAAHKGDCGRVAVVGGAPGFSGAVRIAAEGAARSGAGTVTVFTHPDHSALINLARPELMCRGIDPDAGEEVIPAAMDCIALGPGLGREPWSRRVFESVIDSDRPLVIDADGLNLLAETGHGDFSGPAVLTPHPGEASRLLGCATGEIENDRPGAARELARRYRAVCVLKGSGTVVFSPGGEMRICAAGNSAMASGGTGDLLAGMIAGFAGQGYTLADAAELGVYIHAAAADRWVVDNGPAGLLALDLAPDVVAVRAELLGQCAAG